MFTSKVIYNKVKKITQEFNRKKCPHKKLDCVWEIVEMVQKCIECEYPPQMRIAIEHACNRAKELFGEASEDEITPRSWVDVDNFIRLERAIYHIRTSI